VWISGQIQFSENLLVTRRTALRAIIPLVRHQPYNIGPIQPESENVSILTFEPLYKERVWGGRWLAAKFGRALPGGGSIGESWEVVDRAEAQSVEADSGKTLREILQQRPEEIMGPGYDPDRPFPILVKWLDCSARLSLQVHPPAPVAEQLHGEPKTECWYIADATREAALIVGLKRGVTREQFKQAIAAESLEPLLHRFPVRPGQSMLLESGRLHAIDAGNLILEIQENSDTTYRVYDWGRKGLDGQPRRLHLSESLQSIDFDDFEPEARPPSTSSGETVLARSTKFRLRQFKLGSGQSLELPADVEPALLSMVAGSLVDDSTGQKLGAGDNALSPYAATTRLSAQEPSTVLVTDRFTGT